MTSGCHLSEIHKFCQTLNFDVKSLETLGKLSRCLSMVRGILDKLPRIKADLVSGKPGWQDWSFAELIQSIEEWKSIHPMEVNEKVNEIPLSSPSRPPPPTPRPSTRVARDRFFYAKTGEPTPGHACVYCDRVTHRSWECDSVHLQQSADVFCIANACALTALVPNIVPLNAVAVHLAHTANKGTTRPFAIDRRRLDAKQQAMVEWLYQLLMEGRKCAIQLCSSK